MGSRGTPPGPLGEPREFTTELNERLQELGYSGWPTAPSTPTAWELWVELFGRFGRRVTLVDLYQLEAAARGVRVADLSQEVRDQLATQVLPRQFPGWTPAEGSARPHEPIVVVPYHPGWPAAYESWERRVRAALGGSALRVDHVGSTSVPGLAAKPVIDIQVSVVGLADENRYAPQLAAIGVPLRNRDSLHRFFCPRRPNPRIVQIHVCPSGSVWERDHLLYRDYLRAHAEVRQAYGELKRELAKRWRDDRIAYTDTKSGFILDALSQAEKWGGATGWSLTSSGE